MAYTSLAGLRGSLDFSPDERPRSFRELITFIGFAGAAPIFALSSRAKKAAVADPQFFWWAEADTLTQLQVAGALVSTDTLVTVDSADPDATTLGKVHLPADYNPSTGNSAGRWGGALNLVPGDVLMVEPAADVAAWGAAATEFVEVTGVMSQTQFTVRRGVQGTSAGAIPDNSILTKIGTSFAEGTGAPKATSRNPIKYGNYLQIFKTSYELTNTTTNIGNMRTGDPTANDKKRRSRDHAKDIEFSLIFGLPSETIDPENGKPKRTMGGLRYFIPSQNKYVYSAATTVDSLLDRISPVFNIDTPAANERIAFCGNGTLNEINKLVAKGSSGNNGWFNWGDSIKVFGMELKALKFPQGTIYLQTHPLFNQHAYLNRSMMLIDFSAIRWRHAPGRDTKFEDNIQLPGEDVKRGQWLTEGGLEVDYGGLTCGYIGNISAT